MKIEVFQKYNIFSSVASDTLIPKTTWKVRVYPTLLVFEDLLSPSFIKMKMNIKGPVKEFRIFLNLQKGSIQIQGFSKKGFFRYRIYAQDRKYVFLWINSLKDFLLIAKTISRLK